MFSPVVLEHFRNPRNTGRLTPPAVAVEVVNPACGDILRLSAHFEEDIAVEVRFLVQGCTAAIAAGSVLTELAAGKHRRELALLGAATVESALGGLPPASHHAAILAADALRALISELFAKGSGEASR
jgi:nitrogen fixation NifU-like protein